MRTAIMATNAALPPAHDILETEVSVPMRDGYQVVARVRKPKHPSSDGCPLIILAFGGGWIAGDNNQMIVEARAFARAFSAVVVNITYRLTISFGLSLTPLN
jgi:acetyl esterase/lipase